MKAGAFCARRGLKVGAIPAGLRTGTRPQTDGCTQASKGNAHGLRPSIRYQKPSPTHGQAVESRPLSSMVGTSAETSTCTSTAKRGSPMTSAPHSYTAKD